MATVTDTPEVVRKGEVVVAFTFTDDEYMDAGRHIEAVQNRFGPMSNTEAVLKALELASTMPPPKPQEGQK